MLSTLTSYLRTILLTPANWLVSAGRWMQMSLPARVMIVLFVFVILVEIGYFGVLWYVDTNNAYFSSRLKTFFLPFLVILIALPVSAYYATRFWLETPPSEYPDIDEAWRLGLEALAKAGIDINDVPLYLTLGVSDAKTADQVMQAANWDLKVDGEPSGAQPLRWYASDRAAMLFLLDASATSAIQRIDQLAESSGPDNIRGTLVGASPTDAGGGRGIRGTIVAGAEPKANPFFSGSPAAGEGARSSIKGTMIAGAPLADQPAQSPSPQLARQDRIEHNRRLGRVCELAVGTRLPHCPINGLLTIVDWNVLLASRDAQLSSSMRSDYDAIVQSAKMVVPMVVLVNGLDVDPGFVELSRRVGEDKAKNNRFGHGFNHLIPPNSNQLGALSAHAAGAFEDWIYDLFRHPDCLDRSNNEKLFGLLCRTRNELAPRLSEMLAGLAGTADSDRTLMLAGCYFGATGRNQAKQAFVRSVVEKLVELEDDIEWSPSALEAEARLQGVLRLVTILNALLVAFILGVIAYKFFIASS